MNARALAGLATLAVLPLALAGCPKEPVIANPTPAPSATATPAVATKPVATPAPVTLLEPENPVVAIRLVFRTGSADDPSGKEGLARLTAEVMADGGTKKLSSSELLEKLYPWAASLSSTTEREATVFVGRCHRDHLAEFLPIMADVVLEPRMDPKEFERLKTDAINGLTLGLRTSDDENLGKELLESMLAKGHPYGHPPIGTESGLTSIKLADVEEFRKKRFGAARLTIGIAGGYDQALFQQFLQRFASLEAGDPPPKERMPIPAEESRNLLIVEKPTASTAVSMGFNIDVKRGDPDFFELRMAMGWFGEHRQGIGRLFQEIREKRGLNYGDYAYVEDFVEHPGTVFARNNILRSQQHFSIWIRPVKNENAHFAMRAALWQFDSMLKQGMSEGEFREIRDWLTGYSRLWELTTDRRLGYALDSAQTGQSDYLDAFRKAMAKMTAQQVNEAIRRRLGDRELQIAVVTENGEAFKEGVLSGKPSPIHYGDATPPAEITKDDPTIASFPFGVQPRNTKVIPVSKAFE